MLTAGSMMVRRDKRLQLRGNNLVITQLEVPIVMITMIMIMILITMITMIMIVNMIMIKRRWMTGVNTIVRSRRTATSPFLSLIGLTSFCLPG